MSAIGYPAFSRYGVELEYMLVDAGTLDVCPVADRILRAAAGSCVNEWEAGTLAWSNELALHVIELKTNGPASTLTGLAGSFNADVARVEALARGEGARLMPTGMHPWMDPHRETRLWPHGQNQIYASFDRIFTCQGHGWSNLQSTHLNLPFANDTEFGRLHAAIRFILPLLPGLAASSPFVEGQVTGCLDNRLAYYARNAARVFSVTGHVIPERAYTTADYQSLVLQPIYDDLVPHDPEGVLREEWVNARGAIARFERNTIEIRLLDVQECPAADLAIVHLVTETLKYLCHEQAVSMDALMAWDEKVLAGFLTRSIRDAEEACIDDDAYTRVFGVSAPAPVHALWRAMAAIVPPPEDPAVRQALAGILDLGPLARRCLRVVGKNPSHDALRWLYSALSDHLAGGLFFRGDL